MVINKAIGWLFPVSLHYTLRNKSLNEWGCFPPNGFQWKTHIELTFYHKKANQLSMWRVILMWVFHWNMLDVKYPHSFNDLFLRV